MCKFHDDPVASVIVDPVRGDVDPVRMAVIKAAMAGQQSTQFLPQFLDLSGNNTYLIATPRLQTAFESTDLPKDLAKIEQADRETESFLRDALSAFIADRGLTEESLNLPQSAHRQRRELRRFLGNATDDMYQDIVSPDRLPFKQDVKNPVNKPLFDATKEFLQTEGVEQALGQTFRHAVARTFIQAPELAQKSWLGRLLVKQNETKPDSYLSKIERCGESVCTGLTGFLGCKLSCALLPSAITWVVGASGAAIASNPVVTFGSMLAGPVVGYGFSEIYYKSRDIYPSPNDKRWRERSIAAAFVLSALTMSHDAMGHDDHAPAAMQHQHGAAVMTPTGTVRHEIDANGREIMITTSELCTPKGNSIVVDTSFVSAANALAVTKKPMEHTHD